METPKIRKFTALVHKTFGEFASFESFNETGKLELCTHALPDPRPEGLTIQLIKDYYEQHDQIAVGDCTIEDLEIKTYEYCEEGVLGADIRNKLSPIKTLLGLLTIYKENKHRMDWNHKEYVENAIVAFVEKCEENVTYLSKLI